MVAVVVSLSLQQPQQRPFAWDSIWGLGFCPRPLVVLGGGGQRREGSGMGPHVSGVLFGLVHVHTL